MHFVRRRKNAIYVHQDYFLILLIRYKNIFLDFSIYGKLKILQFTNAYRTMDGALNGSILY